jgi:Protein of unknown function (DUF2934)
MNREEFAAWEDRIRARADHLWEAAGRPDGSRDGFVAQARELLAIEEVKPPTIDPEKAAEPVVEEASIQRNLGEFPTLTDQGDEQTYPDLPHDVDAIRLSDGDASETGGVLPREDLPDQDLPDVSLADADITTSALDADDEPLNDDLNDDGLPDPTDLDAEGEMEDGDEYEEAAVDNDDHEDDALARRIDTLSSP